MTQAVVRAGLSYDFEGGEVTSSLLIDAPSPESDFVPEANSGGVWVSVHDAEGTPRFHLPLPDPRIGEEFAQAEGELGKPRAPPGRRNILVELPWYGEGSAIRIHGRSKPPTRRRALGATAIAELPLEPRPFRATRSPLPVIVEPVWGHANPRALTLAFLPDGFAAGEMDKFRNIVRGCIAAFARTPPFDQLLDAMRAVRIEMPSVDSGIIGKQPRDTCFEGRFTIDRVIDITQRKAEKVLNQNFASSAVALIVANTTDYGGSGGAAAVFSCEPNWCNEIAIHELGHSLFLLADEYSAGGQAATLEPVEANVSGTAERARIKWSSLIAPGTPLPTAAADLPPGAQPSAFVGAFEGAKYQSEDIFRPSLDCKMRTPGVPFCPVCTTEIRKRLSRHLPA